MNPSASDIGIWIGIAILIIPAAKVIVDWIRPQTRRIEPQPLEVKPAADYVTRADCTLMHAQTQRFEDQRFNAIESRLSELVASLDRRNAEGESRAAKIHGRIDGVVEAVSELRGQVNTHIDQHPRGHS